MTFKEAKAKVIEMLRKSDVYIPEKPIRIQGFESSIGRSTVCSSMCFAEKLRLYKKIHNSLNEITRAWLREKAKVDGEPGRFI